ncbi:MAG: hypothetical protein ACRD2G_10310, partial [Terriglobia bacterium]
MSSRREFLRALGQLGSFVPASMLIPGPQSATAGQKQTARRSPQEASAGGLGFRFTDVAAQAG